MTTLSLLELNPKSWRCRTDMQNLQAMHRTIMSMFPRADSPQARREFGVLWRIEAAKSPTLLVQSADQPNLEFLPDGYATFDSKNIDRHLLSLRNGLFVRYRATVNPVRSSRAGGRNTQTPIPFKEHPQWWEARARKTGLILMDTPSIASQPTKHINRGNGNSRRIPIYSTRIDGIAEISDADVLRKAIEDGVGRAKAWGCGLLTVAHIR